MHFLSVLTVGLAVGIAAGVSEKDALMGIVTGIGASIIYGILLFFMWLREQ